MVFLVVMATEADRCRVRAFREERRALRDFGSQMAHLARGVLADGEGLILCQGMEAKKKERCQQGDQQRVP